MSEEVWYRYNDMVYAEIDEWGEAYGRGRIEVNLYEYKVIKKTPKGVWLDNYGFKKFVLKDARKRFACPTKQEALESFIARKKKQLKILKAQMDRAMVALHQVESIKTND